MPTLTFLPSGFPKSAPARLRAQGNLGFAWQRIVWATATVGRKNRLHVLKHGEYSLWELVYRIGLLVANIMESQNGSLRRTPAYGALDPSEKSAVSYFLGLGFTKLLASRLFAVPWLLHLDVYYGELLPRLKSRARPDLVGRDRQRQWTVVESKGRTGKAKADLVPGAKAQAEMLTHVQEVPVYRHLASVTDFDGDDLRTQIADPEGDDHGVVLQLPAGRFFADYYALFVRLVTENRHEEVTAADGSHVAMVQIPVVDVRIGLDLDLLRALQRSGGLKADEVESVLARKARARASETGDEDERRSPVLPSDLFVGPDGVAVELGPTWYPPMMMMPPTERGRSPR